MQRVLSTYLFVHRKLTPALLADVAHAGIPAVELFCDRMHFDYRSPHEVHDLPSVLAENHLTLHSVHAPTERDVTRGHETGVPISICDLERLRRLEAVDEIKRALDLVEFVPFRYLVQHVGTARESDDPRKWDAAFNSLEHLVMFAKQRGVTIALENIPGELATPENLRRFIAQTHLRDLRLCFDTGHAHVENGIAHSFETMRELVVTTHVHDNHGETDEHLFPYEGTIDWNATVKALASASTPVPIVLELREPATHPPPPATVSFVPALEGARGVFERFEQALNARA